MTFEDAAVHPLERFAVGVERDSGRFYVSIPVSNGMADYEEYYAIDRATFDHFLADLDGARPFVARCRAHEMDDLLIVAPGRDRGTP